MNETKIVGKVIKVSRSGWGFISSREIEFTRIFFHWTSLKQDTITFPEIKTGMKVEFIPLKIEGKGWRAMHVRIIDVTKTDLTKETTNDSNESNESSEFNKMPALQK